VTEGTHLPEFLLQCGLVKLYEILLINILFFHSPHNCAAFYTWKEYLNITEREVSILLHSSLFLVMSNNVSKSKVIKRTNAITDFYKHFFKHYSGRILYY